MTGTVGVEVWLAKKVGRSTPTSFILRFSTESGSNWDCEYRKTTYSNQGDSDSHSAHGVNKRRWEA